MKQQKHPNNNKNSPAKPILMIPKQPKTTKNSQKQPKTLTSVRPITSFLFQIID
jgi:hypothetical protein